MRKKIAMILVIVSIIACVPVYAVTTDELANEIKTCQDNKDSCHTIAELGRALGYAEDSILIRLISDRWWEENTRQNELQNQLNEMTPAGIVVPDYKKAQYPYAAEVWEYLRNAGFNKYVVAGIIGNMMAECGGQTLKLQPFLGGRGYYGLCMWYVKYTPQVAGQGVQGQCKVLVDTIKHNFDLFGGNYNSFVNLQNEKTAAHQFEIYYGRGKVTSSNMSKRMNNATKALNYFGE